MRKKSTSIYTLDIETDPFKHGRYPKPFAIGCYDGENFVKFWGDDCIAKMRQFLEWQQPGIIYAHNGGRFDVFFLMDWIVGHPMRIINSRIIKATFPGVYGDHEIRDSYAIMPFALGDFKGKTQKIEIDIKKLEKKVREKHKDEILIYLERDCVLLWQLCKAFIEMFGPQLTIGTTAMKQLKAIHPFENLDREMDIDFREKYFYGGRVQCFKKGIHKGRFKVFDVNSMYPYVMGNVKHPIGKPSWESDYITDDTFFITATGLNKGAFPMRSKHGIGFETGRGTYHVTIHEWRVALKYGMFIPDTIHRCINFEDVGTFSDFVTKFYQARLQAKADGDEINAMMYKFVLNSAYGKFAQNPENYKEYQITDQSTNLSGEWHCEEIVELSEDQSGRYLVWSKPNIDVSRFNVATGASITGAARAKLMEGIATATNPLYCDTDSIICEDLSSVSIDSKELGAWKLEASADMASIAGKKLYALFLGKECVKKANKGVRVTPQEITRMCQGEVIQTHRDSPSFRLTGDYDFISRKVRMT